MRRVLTILVPNRDPVNWMLEPQVLEAFRAAFDVRFLAVKGVVERAETDRLAAMGIPFSEFERSMPGRLEGKLWPLVNQAFMQKVGAESYDMQTRLARASKADKRQFRAGPEWVTGWIGATGGLGAMQSVLMRCLKSRSSRVDEAVKNVPEGSLVLQPYFRQSDLAAELFWLRSRGCVTVANLGGWDPLEYAGWIPDVLDGMTVWNGKHERRLANHYPGRRWRVAVTGQFKFKLWADWAVANVPQERPTPERWLFVDAGRGGERYDELIFTQLCQRLAAVPTSERPEIWRKAYGEKSGTSTLHGVEVRMASRADVSARWPECDHDFWKHGLVRKCSLTMGGGSTLQIEGVLCGTPTTTPVASGYSAGGQALFDEAYFMGSHQRELYETGTVPFSRVEDLRPDSGEIIGELFDRQLRLAESIAYDGASDPLGNLVGALGEMRPV